MRTDRQLSQDPLRQWFTLDELLNSVLADVIETDANFQLMQGEAWRRFGQSLNTLHNIPQIDSLDFSVGFGRLENLALGELDLNFDIERYKPSFFKRCWWGVLQFVFRKSPPHDPAHFRLAHSNKMRGNRVELHIKVCRNNEGRWEVGTEPGESELAVA